MNDIEIYAEKLKKADSLARDVLKLSRNTLLVNLRFLDMALSRLEPKPSDVPLATDGKMIFYDPVHILRCYAEAKERPAREFNNLKGLIYFTDGFGNFPAKNPDYQTASSISATTLSIPTSLRGR